MFVYSSEWFSTRAPPLSRAVPVWVQVVPRVFLFFCVKCTTTVAQGANSYYPLGGATPCVCGVDGPWYLHVLPEVYRCFDMMMCRGRILSGRVVSFSEARFAMLAVLHESM